MEAELYTAMVPADTNEFEWVFDTEIEGYVYDGYMRSFPTETNVQSDLTRSPRLDYDVEMTQPGTYYIWARVLAPTSAQNSIHLGDSGVMTAERIDIPETEVWVWKNQTNAGSRAMVEVNEAGIVTINCWMRESGACVDKLLLTSDPNYVPEGIEVMDPMTVRVQSDDPNDPNGLVAMEAELYAGIVPADTNEFKWVSDTELEGYSLEAYMRTFPTETNVQSDLTRSPRLDYDVMMTRPGTYYIWARVLAPTSAQNSIHLGDSGVMTAERLNIPDGGWVWVNETNDGSRAMVEVIEPNLVTINCWMRESGACVDKLLLTMVPNYVPSSVGPRDPLVAGISLYVPMPIITADPVDDMTFGIDDANNVILTSINGISTQDLILGTTLSERGVMDDFNLERDYDNDIDGVFITTFNVPVTQIFIVEKDGNDNGKLQPIDAEGNPIGDPLSFSPDNFSDSIDGVNGEGDNMSGTVITAEVPIYGIEIWASGLDPYSISALAHSPVVRPLESMEVDDPNVAEPSADIPILVTALNGIQVSDLILGTTTARIGQQERADNFDVSSNPGYTARTNSENPPENLVITMFDVPVSQVFVLEKDGQDDCIVTLLDANGDAVGPEIPFEGNTWAKTQTSEWVIGGISITPKAPIYGIQIYSTGVDIISVSAVPALAQ
jgi:hypothetical protein